MNWSGEHFAEGAEPLTEREMDLGPHGGEGANSRTMGQSREDDSARLISLVASLRSATFSTRSNKSEIRLWARWHSSPARWASGKRGCSPNSRPAPSRHLLWRVGAVLK